MVNEREKNKSLEEELIKIKRESQNPISKEFHHMITNLKVQIEEARRIEETHKRHLEEKHFWKLK
jgi:hypothetical protein